RQYTFDLCAHEGFDQEEMFQSCGLMPLLSAAINGYAGTVFAYGATGAGKTYTMSGLEQVLGPGRSSGAGRGGGGDGANDKTEGLVPRSMRFLFHQISALPPAVTMRMRASFYEIYNELVYDLLAQGDRRPLQGNGNRRVSSHLLNKDSSRSHSLL
ncbi:unnamed protein product, partial [Scytosiphon promiscuus]